jgi:FeS assembly protein IscX
MGLKWTDRLAIAEELFDRFPDRHPLSGVRFTELHEWIVTLDDFDDDPGGSSEGILESIQMAWWAEYKEEHPEADPYG